MPVQTSDFKKGMCIRYEDKICRIEEFQHVKPGKGPAFFTCQLRDIRSGRKIERTFNPGKDSFDEVRMENREMMFLYNDGEFFNFMDPVSYEQIAVNAETVGDAAQWLKENDTATLLLADEELISVEAPMFVELEITQTDPGFKGDTVQGGTKPATLETGATIQVPMYLNQGEIIKVDTRDGRFVQRV